MQFSIEFKSGLLPGYLLLFTISHYLSGLMAGCTVMREHFRAMNVVKVEHVLFQDLQVEFSVHLFVFGEKVQASPAFFP